MLSLTDELNCLPITQEPLAQFQTNIFQSKEFTQEPLAQIQKIDKTISAMLQTSIDDIEKDFKKGGFNPLIFENNTVQK
mgnify:CR=1 FL=1